MNIIQEKSFDVQDGTQMIYMEIQMPPIGDSMGFAIVKDTTSHIRYQALLKCGAQECAIGITGQTTSVGGVPGTLSVGSWNVVVGCFKEQSEAEVLSAEVVISTIQTKEFPVINDPVGEWVWTKDAQLCISDEKYKWGKVYEQGARWYKGDFHTHTTLSDGKESRSGVMVRAREMQLDFFVPTEHNLMHTGWSRGELCILPGTEITTKCGHFNLFGVTQISSRVLDLAFEQDPSRIEQYVAESIQEARNKGWIVSINHPFLSVWSWQCANILLEKVDCIEIVNDPTYPDGTKANEQAIALVDELWQDGYHIYGVGGSDAHNLIYERYEGADAPSVVGDPGTYVYCNELTPENIMQQVICGHMYVSRFCTIEPDITIGEQTYLPGDELCIDESTSAVELHYCIKIHGLLESPVVHFIKNKEATPLVVHLGADGGYEAELYVMLPIKTWTWMRMDVRTTQGEFLGYTNPVYLGSKKPDCRTFGDIVDRMEDLAYG